jgi:hypothetical protein
MTLKYWWVREINSKKFSSFGMPGYKKDQLFKIYEKVIPKPICITENNDHAHNSGSSSIHNEQT